MSPNPGSYEIRSEPRGPHWIAWIVRSGSTQPDRSVVVVGETQEEAETKAKGWAQSNSPS